MIGINNQVATYGVKVNELGRVAEDYRVQNSILENKVASESSLRIIEQKSKALGFESTKKVEYITWSVQDAEAKELNGQNLSTQTALNNGDFMRWILVPGITLTVVSLLLIYRRRKKLKIKRLLVNTESS